MSNGVGITRSERKEILLERIAQTKSLIAAHSELADMIDKSEARSVAHQQVWKKVARRLRMDARELQTELDHAEQRLADITMAQQAADGHVPHVDRPSRITVT